MLQQGALKHSSIVIMCFTAPCLQSSSLASIATLLQQALQEVELPSTFCNASSDTPTI
jgi:hypothetical protein